MAPARHGLRGHRAAAGRRSGSGRTTCSPRTSRSARERCPDEVEEITPDEARRRFPPLGEIRTAWYSATRGARRRSVDDGRAARCGDRGRAHGRSTARSTRSRPTAGRVTGVVAGDGGRSACDAVAIAGGAWTPALADQLGVDDPGRAGPGPDRARAARGGGHRRLADRVAAAEPVHRPVAGRAGRGGRDPRARRRLRRPADRGRDASAVRRDAAARARASATRPSSRSAPGCGR